MEPARAQAHHFLRTGRIRHGVCLSGSGSARLGDVGRDVSLGSYDLHDWGERYDPGRPAEWRWATWKRDRLVALEAPVEGRVTLVERECEGSELTLNFQTQKEGGWIKAELVEPPSSPAAPVRAIEGFGLEEADVLAGDELAKVATWRGTQRFVGLARQTGGHSPAYSSGEGVCGGDVRCWTPTGKSLSSPDRTIVQRTVAQIPWRSKVALHPSPTSGERFAPLSLLYMLTVYPN